MVESRIEPMGVEGDTKKDPKQEKTKEVKPKFTPSAFIKVISTPAMEAEAAFAMLYDGRQPEFPADMEVFLKSWKRLANGLGEPSPDG